MSATCWPERKLRAFDSRENVYRTESQVGGNGYSMMKAASINPPSPIAMISIVVLSNFSSPSMRIDERRAISSCCPEASPGLSFQDAALSHPAAS